MAQDDGLSLMDRGAQMILRGLITELEPALDDLAGLADDVEPALRDLVATMGPALLRLADLIDQVQYYELPEILDNGDIVIRRSPDAPPYVPDTIDPPEEIDL